jgi:hypothetical protein
MKKNLVILMVMFLSSCKTQGDKNDLTKEEILLIEKKIINVKNLCFNDLYYKSKLKTHKRLSKEVQICDESSKIKNLTHFYYSQRDFIDLYEFSKDKNKEKLINNWLNKKEYIPIVNPPDYPNGSLDLVCALDFYNSNDLEMYTDSIRKSEQRKILLLKK